MNTEASVGGVNAAHALAKDGPVAVPAPPTVSPSGKRPSRPQDQFVSGRDSASEKPNYHAAAVEWLTALSRGEAVPGCLHTDSEDNTDAQA